MQVCLLIKKCFNISFFIYIENGFENFWQVTIEIREGSL
jgi:hypothetical protein